MSWQASKYARDLLEAGGTGIDELTAGDRLVFMLLAERAGSRTGEAIGGEWLATASGLSPASVRRAFRRLAAGGAIAYLSRPPRPLIARFPLAAMLSTTRAEQRAYDDDELSTTSIDARAAARLPAQQRAHMRAPARAVPQGRVENHSDVRRRWCDDDCVVCQGVGFIEIPTTGPDGRPSTGWAPCTERTAA